ncbi:trans-aconitate 2-methyltransferase [Mycobacterium sp. SMC-4]|uniref:trans-aconitate 2-methyltransferase n=1 Tax=Mycobacterium sp. SMC-4 TaxID=2857059 RepID=UPI0021B303FE|nr:trans-aconitate 2-methyltransferase [Mycobacterium sp. SMC-4]UXA20492.1 trans-aconitate 2-methyltransferase [Mycobacterium sp. SMC-4]
MWDPDSYLAFVDQRGRPFVDLLSRVGARDPRRVVDLGCGPGNVTLTLTRRWPETTIEAWDSSPQMVAAARDRGLHAHLGDLREWTPKPDTDVVISNATLHWVPEHPALLARWAGQLGNRAWLAVQVPGNFDAPSHQSVREVAARPRWSKLLAPFAVLPDDAVLSAAGYAASLIDVGCEVDAWETTYIHQLTGPDAVLEWITGSALRPIRDSLDDQDWDRFRRELAPLLRRAYPRRADGTTLFSFRRVFVVAQVVR